MSRPRSLTGIALVLAVLGFSGAVCLLLDDVDEGWGSGWVSDVPNLFIAAALLSAPLVGRWPLPVWRVLAAGVIWFCPMLPIGFIVSTAPQYAGLLLVIVVSVYWICEKVSARVCRSYESRKKSRPLVSGF